MKTVYNILSMRNDTLIESSLLEEKDFTEDWLYNYYPFKTQERQLIKIPRNLFGDSLKLKIDDKIKAECSCGGNPFIIYVIKKEINE